MSYTHGLTRRGPRSPSTRVAAGLLDSEHCLAAPRQFGYIAAPMNKLISRSAAALGCLLWLASSSAVDAATVRVHYDTGWGNRISVRGSKAPFSWTAGVDATW